MEWGATISSGFVAVVLALSLLRILAGLGWMAYTPTVLVGCLLVGDPRRPIADTLGLVLLLVLGSTVVAVVYAIAMRVGGGPDWPQGATVGLLHGMVLVAALPVYGTLSACVRRGQLAAPGRWGLGWGRMTPVALVVAHVVYGGVLGAVLRAF